MSDFDAVLERLVADPGFRAALAADPARALAGYRLSADEVELLHAQLDTGTGGNRHVEQRTSKASLFGLLSPLAGCWDATCRSLGMPPAGSPRRRHRLRRATTRTSTSTVTGTGTSTQWSVAPTAASTSSRT